MLPLVIVNLTARRIAREPALVAALRRLPADVVTTSTLADLDDVTASRQAPRTVLVGGDGSHMAGLSSLARRGPLPEVALVSAGTVGTAARSFGSRGRVVEEVAAALTSTRVTDEPSLSVSLDDDRRLIGFTFGAGLVSGFFQEYEASQRGIAAAAGLALKIALGAPLGTALATRALAKVPAALDVDGRALPESGYSLIVVSVLRDVGLGIKVAYRALERPDRVHVVASSATPTGLALAAHNTLMGRRLGGASTVDELVAKLGVSFPSPTRVIVDGDTFETRAVTVTPGPRLKLVRANV